MDFGDLKLPSINPLEGIQRRIDEDNRKRKEIMNDFYETKQLEKQKVEEHYSKTEEMAQEIKELKIQLNSISHTLDLMHMSMGQHGQRATKEHIEIKELLEKYINIMTSSDSRTTKDNRLLEFFKSIPTEVALKIVIDGGMAIMKYAFT